MKPPRGAGSTGARVARGSAARNAALLTGAAITAVAAALACSAATPAAAPLPGDGYPWHTDIVATTFWVGEVFDPSAEDGSQVMSTYDSQWMRSYGGCDGVETADGCVTERRVAANGYFPRHMVPKENPFYLDLPFDDIHNAAAFASRAEAVPWARSQARGNTSLLTDPGYSFMKNRWVQLRRGTRVCFGQIQDAGPGMYDDAAYVFGSDDQRPANQAFNGAGLDVSPAINGCLGFTELNGQEDLVDWRFVEEADVPDGPWKRIVTTSQVQ